MTPECYGDDWDFSRSGFHLDARLAFNHFALGAEQSHFSPVSAEPAKFELHPVLFISSSFASGLFSAVESIAATLARSLGVMPKDWHQER